MKVTIGTSLAILAAFGIFGAIRASGASNPHRSEFDKMLTDVSSPAST